MPFSLLQTLRDIPLAFVDVETNGCSARRGHRVIEIGVVRVENGVVTAEYQQLIDPRRRISPMITRMTGITATMCLGQPTFAQQTAKLIPVLAGAVVVGHNVKFDLSFLYVELRRARVPIGQHLGKLPVLDTVRIARKRFGRGGNALGLLSRRLGIEPEGAHRALADAKTTHLVLRELLAPLGGWDVCLADAFAHQGGPMHLEFDESEDAELQLCAALRV